MPVRLGFLGVAHMHAYGYAAAIPRLSDKVDRRVGVWDDVPGRAEAFAAKTGATVHSSADALLESVDAAIVTSENTRHAALVGAATSAGRHVLCEKPLATTDADGQAMIDAVDRAGVKLSTAFPCRYSPAFQRLSAKVDAGEIGAVVAVCATNRGRCPFDWFVERDKSGGGAIIDHVVHVADLLRALLKSEPKRVHAATGNKMYGKDWEDTAMLTIEFDSGVFASLDSSWSRPQGYKTWGDVTMNVIGEAGVIEMDMFGQNIDLHQESGKQHSVAPFGSDLDLALVADFADCIAEGRAPTVSGFDGLQAARVALAGYRSAECGQPVDLLP